MQQYESMEDAVRVARDVLAGRIDPNLGCGLIGGIAEKLAHPDRLVEFVHLAHLQEGHESLRFTAPACVPDILAECRKLVDANLAAKDEGP